MNLLAAHRLVRWIRELGADRAIFLCVFSKRRSNPSPRVVNMLCATQPDATALTKQVEQLRCDYLHTVVHKILQLRTLQ
ncbi:hypothetical protein BRADI_1g78976v3 [Brachypodium distachyon]|uniref:Uncharacterized protein n=1 Tax=Brachypodium distachyon TaxID=15368 RepID=A0A2K2DVV6_BRADI|nr:hypothetical protein BRADI_1g78976v3 [Brachypodium distachyon]